MSTPCPSCSEPLPADAQFCEACGAPVSAAPAPTAQPTAGGVAVADQAAPIDPASGPVSRLTRVGGERAGRPCHQCGARVGQDGYCETCGAKALSERDHFGEQPTSWVAGLCDKGLAHHRNEDAMAMTSTGSPTAADRRAVLVVLDGVSRTDDSAVGSLAGARAALEVLAPAFPAGLGTPASRLAAATQVLARAAEVANEQVVAATTPGTDSPASATFTAVVLEGTTLLHANIGDSRTYWLPDQGPGVQLSVDHSAAQAQIAAGVPRPEAESSPQAHAITQWLGQDSPSVVPTVGRLDLGPDAAGWLLACSDGLWNYASEPEQLTAQLRTATPETTGEPTGDSTDPAGLVRALVDFANAQGGRDNITAVLARVDPVSSASAPPVLPVPPPDPASDPTTTGESHG